MSGVLRGKCRFDEREDQASETRLVGWLEEAGCQDSLQPVGFAVSTYGKKFGAEKEDTIAYRQHLARIVSKKRRSRMVITILLRLRFEPVKIHRFNLTIASRPRTRR